MVVASDAPLNKWIGQLLSFSQNLPDAHRQLGTNAVLNLERVAAESGVWRLP